MEECVQGLLDLLVRADPGIGALRQRLVVRDSWKKSDFAEMKKRMQDYTCDVEIDRIDLDTNPMIFEHESFTDLILALSHLTEELKARNSLSGLPAEDTGHLGIDLRRVYSRLIPEWLRYMEYLQTHYPYLFHLAMRKNPFDASASVVIGRKV